MVQQGEAKLVNKWISAFHRSDPHWTRVRLGQVDSPEEAALYSVILRWADAIILSDGKILLVEAKLRPTLGAIGQLEGYKELIRVTPRFSAYSKWPIEMILLTPFLDLNIVEIATKKGIKYEHWDYQS